jgi:alpha-galactosidase
VQGQLINGQTTDSAVQIWSKPLAAQNSRAVLLLNRNSATTDITVNFADVGLTGSVSVRDISNYPGADKGTFSGSYTAQCVQLHQSVILLLVAN